MFCLSLLISYNWIWVGILTKNFYIIFKKCGENCVFYPKNLYKIMKKDYIKYNGKEYDAYDKGCGKTHGLQPWEDVKKNW